jgi:hypothetical protein
MENIEEISTSFQIPLIIYRYWLIHGIIIEMFISLRKIRDVANRTRLSIMFEAKIFRDKLFDASKMVVTNNHCLFFADFLHPFHTG